MKKFSKTHLLVPDDLGLTALNENEPRDLLEVIEERHSIGSTLITSQLPVEKWHDHIGDPRITDTILDRIIHNVHRLQLKGGSTRKNKNLTRIDVYLEKAQTNAKKNKPPNQPEDGS